MSHELEDNIDRRKHILAKIRQYPKGVSSDELIRIIMEKKPKFFGNIDIFEAENSRANNTIEA